MIAFRSHAKYMHTNRGTRAEKSRKSGKDGHGDFAIIIIPKSLQACVHSSSARTSLQPPRREVSFPYSCENKKITLNLDASISRELNPNELSLMRKQPAIGRDPRQSRFIIGDGNRIVMPETSRHPRE